jgi:tetratricopeptide (TPR) repeat protein
MCRSNLIRAAALGAVIFQTYTASSAQTNSSARADETAWTQHVVQAYQQLQEQQQATLTAIEQTREQAAATAHAVQAAREDAELAAKRSDEQFEARLKQIEQAVTAERGREIEAMQSSHRFTLLIIGVFAGVGFFGLLFFAGFALRNLNRRVGSGLTHEIGPSLDGRFAVAGALGSGDASLAVADPAQRASARFLTTIERLEKRIQEMELAASPIAPAAEAQEKLPAAAGSATPSAAVQSDSATAPAGATNVNAARIALLIGKGQTLLSLQQADTALACFDEVIALDPTNADAFVRKGTALEKIGQLDAAIDCYDRAIALDTSMTMAYLCKGGVFNRLERHGEALQCYEQALRAQQKLGVA